MSATNEETSDEQAEIEPDDDSSSEEEATSLTNKSTLKLENLPGPGCSHYKRKCRLIAPCCKKTYTCRLCHDENENHEVNRYKVEVIQCMKCEKIQKVQQTCEDCGEVFGNYFCAVCRLFDDIDKKQFHCDGCQLCRVGGRDKFFHCDKCGVCLSNELRNAHKCIEQSSHSNCPVCMEDLHTSRISAHIPPCGHLIHVSCFNNMMKTGHYACAVCNQSMIDMKTVWKSLDEEIQVTHMPEEYRNFRVQILCRDCHKECKVLFHVLGLKCQHCGSYNTCRAAEEEESVEHLDSTSANQGQGQVTASEASSGGHDPESSTGRTIAEEENT